MSQRKVRLTVAIAAALALGACTMHETRTSSVSSETHFLNDSRYSYSSAEMFENQGASSSIGASGNVGSEPVQRVYEIDGWGRPARRVQ